MKQPTSIRLSDLTTRQLAELVSATGTNQSAVIAIAIDRMYQQENKTMTSKAYPAHSLVINEMDTGNTRTVWATPLHNQDGVEFGHFAIDDLHPVAYVHYEDDDLSFTTVDWQGQQPATLEDIPDFTWCSENGDDAIILDGFPRLI